MDLGYKDFNSKLLPTVDPRTMAGVRTPALRKIAKELARRDDANAFLRTLPHRLFDENQVHAFCLGLERDYDTALELYEPFLPHVDNWATCDQLPVKVLAKRTDETLERVERWLASKPVSYTHLFSIVTTAPNATIAPVHDRMPLVLREDEVESWLAGDPMAFADRSTIALDVTPEDEGNDPEGQMQLAL